MRACPRLLPLLTLVLAPLAFAPQALAASSQVDPRINQLLDQLGKVRAIGQVQLSPDGQRLGWVVRTVGKPSPPPPCRRPAWMTSPT